LLYFVDDTQIETFLGNIGVFLTNSGNDSLPILGKVVFFGVIGGF
jgi:hypothetical protein